MGRYGAVEKMLFPLTAVGGLLTVIALAFFALTGTGFGADLLRGAAGMVLGMMTVQLLTRSSRNGGRIAALLLLATVVGLLAFALTLVSFSGAVEEATGGFRFVPSFLVSAAVASVLRLLGVNPMGPRGGQVSRRRS